LPFLQAQRLGAPLRVNIGGKQQCFALLRLPTQPASQGVAQRLSLLTEASFCQAEEKRQVFGDEARLQHALGVTVADDGYLYVADTYNNKIKRINPATRASVTFLGTGEPGFAGGSDPLFYEPGGIDYADGKLYIADTNNHAIRVADLATGVVSTVTFPNVERLSDAGAASAAPGGLTGGAFAAEGALLLAPQTVAAGPGTLRIHVTMPDGYKLNDLAPFTAIFPDNPVAQVPAEAQEHDCQQFLRK